MSTNDQSNAKPQANRAETGRCPICKREVLRDAKTFPFCSDRCRTIDLGRWLGGEYRFSRAVNEDDLADFNPEAG